ncbi:MAG: hypothetical protein NVSMB66_1930 [Candidatus Doudnabacteria bacterium]
MTTTPMTEPENPPFQDSRNRGDTRMHRPERVSIPTATQCIKCHKTVKDTEKSCSNCGQPRDEGM